MNWHKMNAALILILFAIDLFLAVMLFRTYRDTRLMPESLIEGAQQNLAEKGIRFEKEVIDRHLYEKPVYYYTAGSAFAEEMKGNAAVTHASLIGALCSLSGLTERELNENIQYFDIPDGTSISFAGKDGVPSASAVISGDTGFEYCAAAFSADGIAEDVRLSLDAPPPAEPQRAPKAVSEFFRRAYDGAVTHQTLDVRAVGDGTLVTSALCVGGGAVRNMRLCFYLENGSIRYVKGNMFFSKPVAEYVVKIIDGVNILYRLPDALSGDLSVGNEKLSCAAMDYEGGSFIFPCWEITLSENGGTQRRLFFNAVTGTYLD